MDDRTVILLLAVAALGFMLGMRAYHRMMAAELAKLTAVVDALRVCDEPEVDLLADLRAMDSPAELGWS